MVDIVLCSAVISTESHSHTEPQSWKVNTGLHFFFLVKLLSKNAICILYSPVTNIYSSDLIYLWSVCSQSLLSVYDHVVADALGLIFTITHDIQIIHPSLKEKRMFFGNRIHTYIYIYNSDNPPCFMSLGAGWHRSFSELLGTGARSSAFP